MERAAEVRWLADRKIDPSRRELASHGNDPTIAIHGPVPLSKTSPTAANLTMHNRPPAPSDPATRPLLRRRLLGAGVAAMPLAWAQAAGAREDPTDAVTLEHARSEFEASRARLIDIREAREHAGGVARGAMLLPMSQLAARLGEIPTDPSQPVLLICHTQNRSRAALKTLRQRGMNHVRYVEGGMSGWVRRGWPVVPPPRAEGRSG